MTTQSRATHTSDTDLRYVRRSFVPHLAGRCDQVSAELRALLADKRKELTRRVDDLRFLDQRMAHLSGQLAAGATPRTLINPGKEGEHAPAL